MVGAFFWRLNATNALGGSSGHQRTPFLTGVQLGLNFFGKIFCQHCIGVQPSILFLTKICLILFTLFTLSGAVCALCRGQYWNFLTFQRPKKNIQAWITESRHIVDCPLKIWIELTKMKITRKYNIYQAAKFYHLCAGRTSCYQKNHINEKKSIREKAKKIRTHAIKSSPAKPRREAACNYQDLHRTGSSSLPWQRLLCRWASCSIRQLSSLG